MTNSTPNRPLLSTRPSSSGTSSNGYTWYPDPTYSTSYATWESHGNIDPNNGGVVVVDETTGYRWTTPVKISGKDGEQGDRGPAGSPGSPGSPGSDGLDGPGLNYRGEWAPGKTYGWTDGNAGNVRDVVKDGSYYYMWNKYYRGSAPVATNSNKPSNSYTTVDGTSDRYWTRFGASFESIATGLLLAETATIAGWEFADEYIYAQSNTMRLDGRTSPLSDVHLAAGSNAASSPGSAPFRIKKDGSMVSTKANITGTISASSGDIGGVQISNGLRGSGWSLSNSGYYCSGDGVNAGFGINSAPATYGKNLPMSISYTNNVYGDYILGSTISANNSKGWAVGLAVTSGFIWSRHGVYDTCKAQLNPNASGNSIQLVWPSGSNGSGYGWRFEIYSTSYSTVYLPDRSLLAKHLGLKSSNYFNIEVLLYASNWGTSYNIFPSSGMSLFDESGKNISSYKLDKAMARRFLITASDTYYARTI